MQQKVERERHLLEGVCSLCDDDARRAGVERSLDRASQFVEVWETQRRSRNLAQVAGFHPGDPEAKARELASDLDVQYDAHGPRAADAIRHVDPAQKVQRATWSTGELDVWIRDNGEWLGRVRDKDGGITWVPGTDLRPL